MSKLILVGVNMDTSCVEARFTDGTMIAVDCKAVEIAPHVVHFNISET